MVSSRSWHRVAVLLHLAASAAGPVWAQPAAHDRDYRVDAGDVLEIIVPRYPEFTRQYLISREGEIALELVGVLPVEGLTPAEVAIRVTEALAEYIRYPQDISVRVVAKRMVVRILGQVNVPGPQELPKSASVQEAITAAGGLRLGALAERIVIRRQQGEWLEEIPVNLKLFLEGVGELPALRNDDVIFVPRVTTTSGIERPLTEAEVLTPQELALRRAQQPGGAPLPAGVVGSAVEWPGAEPAGGREQSAVTTRLPLAGATGTAYPPRQAADLNTARRTARVLGAVRAPGQILLGRDADLLAVLTAAGGWGPDSDLSQVTILPGGVGPAERFDLERYLREGGDLPLVAPGDVVTVPTQADALLEVRVLGAVAQPGPVRVPPGGDLQTALTLAGGPTAAAELREVRILRSRRGEVERVPVDLDAYLRGGEAVGLPELRADDVIFVPKATRAIEAPTATVYVYGEVAKPGPQPLLDTGSLLHAVAAAGGALPTADLRQVRITRPGASGEARTITFDFEAYQEGQAIPLPELLADDVLFLPRRVKAIEAEVASVYVFGHVVKPGPYPLYDQRPLLHALAAAGGTLPTADLTRVKITRAAAGEGQPGRTEVFDLQGYQAGRVTVLPELADGDIVTVEPNRVQVTGQVNQPGAVELRQPASLVEALAAAGGPTAEADLQRITITRRGAGGIERQVVDLERVLYQPEDAVAIPEVTAGDVVAVNTKPTDERLVYVVGEVARPGAIPLPGREASVLYALTQAGGPLPTADQREVSIMRPGEGGLTRERFDLMALTSGLTAANPPLVRPGDIVTVDALGAARNGVLVLGAVARQGYVPVRREGQTLTETVAAAGGLLPSAKPSLARLVRGATGEVIKLNLADVTERPTKPQPTVADGDMLVIGFERNTPTIWDEIMRIFPFATFFLR